MKTISNLRIRTKLLGGFFVVLGLLALVTFFGVRNMGEMREAEQDINTAHIPSAKVLMDVRGAVNEYKRRELAHFLAAERGEIAQGEKRLQESRETIAKVLVAYEALVEDASDRERFDGVSAAWTAYLAAEAPVLALVREKQIDEAVRLSLGPVGEKHAEVIRRINEHLNAEQEATGSTIEASDRIFRTGRAWMIGLGAGAFAIGILLAFLIAGAFARPLAEMRRVVGAAAEGDLSVRAAVQSKDEVGETAESMNLFLERLHDSMVRVAQASAQVAAASEQLSASSEELSSGAQAQASSLEESSASLEEMTGTMKESAVNAQQASTLASESRASADKGGAVVGSAVSAMAEINQSSRKIGEIIGVIDEIAFQTNLLALNAAVEAARAGEQGRGFAVVAAEVRSLAQRSAGAAKEIKALIEDSLRKVEDGSELVNASGATLKEIVSSVNQVTEFVADIAAAGAEQASGIEQVSRAVAQMDRVVQSNSAQTEEMSATAEELAAQAQQLRALVSWFKLEAGGYHTQRVSEPRGATAHPPPRRAASLRPGKTRGRLSPAQSDHRASLAPAPRLSKAPSASEGFTEL